MIGYIIGGCVPIFIFSLLFGRFLFKDTEIKRKIIYSVFVSLFFTDFLSGFGIISTLVNVNDDGSFDPKTYEFFFSSLIVLSLRLIYVYYKKPNTNFLKR